jgi:hypothetical protein
MKGILNDLGAARGLVVHVGCGDGRLTAALHADDGWLVQGLATNPEDMAAARKHIQSLGLYGRVSIAPWSSERLPYVDNLVNVVVAESLGKLPMEEVLRVLAPNGVGSSTEHVQCFGARAGVEIFRPAHQGGREFTTGKGSGLRVDESFGLRGGSDLGAVVSRPL